MLSDELLDDDRWVERAASLHEVVQQSRQDDLRNFEQEVDVLGESGTAAKHVRQTADERVADPAGVERLSQRFDDPYGIGRQEVGVNVHGVR